MKNKYRIIKDGHFFEIQTKKWWFPFFWFQCHSGEHIINIWTRVEDAEAFAQKHARGEIGRKGPIVVKNLGVWTSE